MKTVAAAQVPDQSGADDIPTLEFDHVILRQTWPYDTFLDDVSFSIRPGELLLLTLAPGHVRSPFADLTQALLHPHEGHVRFKGQSWRHMSPHDISRSRFDLARVFDVGGWISNLFVDENVLLAQRYYATSNANDLAHRADELARTFGLDGIPRKRPADTSQFELRLSQWARALLGDVRLLVLERPTKDIRQDAVTPFLKAVREARDRGTAVLWITTDGASPSTPHNIAPADVTAHVGMRGDKLLDLSQCNRDGTPPAKH